jgi:hypothetical protein
MKRLLVRGISVLALHVDCVKLDLNPRSGVWA